MSVFPLLLRLRNIRRWCTSLDQKQYCKNGQLSAVSYLLHFEIAPTNTLQTNTDSMYGYFIEVERPEM